MKETEVVQMLLCLIGVPEGKNRERRDNMYIDNGRKQYGIYRGHKLLGLGIIMNPKYNQ